MTLRQKIKILLLVIPIVFGLDRLTKELILRLIPQGESISIVPGFFDIVHTHNRGAAFGFMATVPDPVRVPFFLTVSALALILITLYFFKSHDPRKMTFICLALILGGAVGNIYDRLTLGEVIDFLSFHWHQRFVHWSFSGWGIHFKLEWPAFNLADSAISVAVVWLMATQAFQKKEDEAR